MKDASKASAILFHAFVGWGLCGSIIGIGREFISMETILVIHAVAVPIIFTLLSLLYFRKFNYTSPLFTAFVFLSFVALMDFFVVALLMERSFSMFYSILGTWVPFISVFLSTYLTGLSQ
jgi:hypothetical protein